MSDMTEGETNEVLKKFIRERLEYFKEHSGDVEKELYVILEGFNDAKEQIKELRTRAAEWKKKYETLNKELLCELRDPCGTIWEHATKLQKENDELQNRLSTLLKVSEGMKKALEKIGTHCKGMACGDIANSALAEFRALDA
mgnify:CR=1 FL=1